MDYKNINKIGLISRINTDLNKDILKLKNILNEKNIELLLLKENAKSLNITGLNINELFKQSDFVISLGGDGTLISLCNKASKYDKALLGIHAGRLGFLTDFDITRAQEFFDDFFKGEFKIEEPFMLDINLEKLNGDKIHKRAFNDIVFSRDTNNSMSYIEVLKDDKVFNGYYGDGLIVATPSGSTAYNLSANGPIVYALAEVFLLTPVCSHSMTQRSIVLPKGFELGINARDCNFIIDGQEHFKTKNFKNIKISLSSKKVKLIHMKNRDYFQVLKEKLHWGN